MKRNAKNSMFFVWTLAIFACLLLVRLRSSSPPAGRARAFR